MPRLLQTNFYVSEEVRLGTEGQIILIRSNESVPPALTGFLKALQETMADTIQNVLLQK
jgi:hypothetical protein